MSGATQEADDEDFGIGILMIAGILFTLLFDAAFGAFIYKVWNERQMTHQYERQAAALERIADAVSGVRYISR